MVHTHSPRVYHVPPITHDPLLCGLDDGGPSSSCPGCRADPITEPPGVSAAQARRRERRRQEARSLRQMIRRHRGLVRRLLIDLLAEDIGRIVAAIAGKVVSR